jgi:hypothetical protein
MEEKRMSSETVSSAILVPAEVQAKLDRFSAILTDPKKGSTIIAHALAEMGIDDPKKCGCGDQLGDDPVLLWTHENHRYYNRLVWGMINSHRDYRLIDKIRRVFSEGMNKSLRGDCGPCRIQSKKGGDSIRMSLGDVLPNADACRLLDHFLWPNPDKATWI